MNIVTNRPIQRMSADQVKECFSNLDSSNLESVKAFQSWFNQNYTKAPLTNKALVVDGVYGKMSKGAYAKYGSEFEKTQPAKKIEEKCFGIKHVFNNAYPIIIP